MKKFLMLLLGFLSIATLAVCLKVFEKAVLSGYLNSQSNIGINNSTQVDYNSAIVVTKQETAPSLRIINLSQQKLLLELANNTDKTIYSFYWVDYANGDVAEIFNYWFRCREDGKEEIDYNITSSHLIPNLEALEKNKSFRFEISPLPKINAKCKVSVLYYDDDKIVDLINNKSLDMNKSERDLVKKGKKSVDLQFPISMKD